MTDYTNLSDDRKQTKNEQLEKRMLVFAVSVIKTLGTNTVIPRAVREQLTRSAASIGANYAEACNASSKLDFRNKIFIAKKEAAESRYWIDMCKELTKSEDWVTYRMEVQELILILQAIVSSVSRKSDK